LFSKSSCTQLNGAFICEMELSLWKYVEKIYIHDMELSV
jgi:hypothetical protein